MNLAYFKNRQSYDTLNLKQRVKYKPYRMFKTIVTCTRIDKIGPSKLFNGSKSLELRSVDDFHTHRIDFNVAMDRVVEYLQFTCAMCCQLSIKTQQCNKSIHKNISQKNHLIRQRRPSTFLVNSASCNVEFYKHSNKK